MPLSESDLHALVVQYLRAALAPEIFFFHVPNEGKRGWRAQRDFKRFGSRTGMVDICIVANGQLHCIELKTRKGALSAAQKGCHMDLAIAGVPVIVARSIEDVMLALKQWDIPTRLRVAA